MVKKELVIFLDVGLIGSFVAWEKASDEKYVYLKYVPIDSFTKKVITYEKPIPRNAIHSVDPILQLKGVPDRIIYIYTEEQGSIAKRVMESNYVREIDELQRKVESLEMKNTSLSQQVENSRSGASKAISDARNLTRSRENEGGMRPSVFDRFGGSSSTPSNDFDFD